MGISCLGCIHIESTGASTCSGPVQIPAKVNIIEFAHGSFGLSAVRFYVGGKKSDWLGFLHHRPQQRWHRYIKNQMQSDTIRFVGEEKLQTIDFGTPERATTEPLPFGHDFLWNPAISLADVYPKESYYPETPHSIWMNYVPLRKENYRLHSLTSFSIYSELRSFQCVFQSKDDQAKTLTILTGKRTGYNHVSLVPVHFRLWENEVISHVWILREPEGYIAIGEEEYCPHALGLILGTNSGRVRIMSVLNQAHITGWRYDQGVQCLSDLQHGEITGLYYVDPFSMGITYSGPPAHHPAITNPTDLAPAGDTKMGCTPTIVQMKDVQRIDIWYTGSRCMGLMITFTDSRQDTLGRWDEGSDEFHQETLFRQEYDSLTFDIMKIALKEYYHDRHIVGGELTKTPYYTVSGISVGRKTVGEMAGDDELVVTNNEFLKWEFRECDQLSKSDVPF